MFDAIFNATTLIRGSDARARRLQGLRRDSALRRFIGRRISNGHLVTHVILYALLALLVFSAAANAEQVRATQSIDSIRRTAEDFVRDAVKSLVAKDARLLVDAAELDARLRLDECAAALQAFTLNDSPVTARTTVGVRCAAPTAWTIYVPVVVESEMNVYVTRASLTRDAHINVQDLTIERRRVGGFGDAYFNNAESLRERHLKRNIASGTVLTNDLLVRDLAIKRGQQVTLVFDTHGLLVQAPGLAMSDGAIADRVRVQNQTSLKIVEGVVESGNLVRVGM